MSSPAPSYKGLPLRSLNHISRVCKDVAACAAFYRDVLGFCDVKRPESFDFEGAWLFNYGIGIHLIAGQPPAREPKVEPKADHLSFQADSLEEVEARLRALNLEHVKQVIDEHGVRVTQLFFHDPEHNMIEICNCDLLPVVPVDSNAPICPACVSNGPGSAMAFTSHHLQRDEEDASDASDCSSDSDYPMADKSSSDASVTAASDASDAGVAAASAAFTNWAMDVRRFSKPGPGLRRSCSLTALHSGRPISLPGFLALPQHVRQE